MALLQRLLHTLAAASAASFLASLAQAQDIPALIQYQGRITDSAGQPINATGLSLRFRLYGQPIGGIPLHVELLNLDVTDGLVSTLIGSASPLPTSIFDDNDELYLGISIGNDAEAVPRHPLVSVPYAFRAETAVEAKDVTGQDIHPMSISIGGATIIDSTGTWVGPTAGLEGPTGPAGPPGLPGSAGPPGTNGPVFADDTPAGWGAIAGATGLKLHAIVELEHGTQVGGIVLWGDDPMVTYEAYAVHVSSGTPTLLGGGALGDTVDLTDYTASLLDYLLVRVDVTSPTQRVFGGAIFAPQPVAPLFSTKFDSSGGLVLDPPVDGVGWAVDATPAVVDFGLPYTSAAGSLNFNDGDDYAAAIGAVSGNATTLGFAIAGTVSPELSFVSRWDTSTGAGTDQRILQISNNNFSTLLVDQVLPNTDGAVWLTERFALDPAWGTVKFRFRFVSDGVDDGHAGWFVDDLVIAESPTGQGAIQARLTPRQFLLSAP